jgi:hypothetical protein
MNHVADLRKNRLFDPISRRFSFIRPTNHAERCRGRGHPLAGAKEPWVTLSTPSLAHPRGGLVEGNAFQITQDKNLS